MNNHFIRKKYEISLATENLATEVRKQYESGNVTLKDIENVIALVKDTQRLKTALKLL